MARGSIRFFSIAIAAWLTLCGANSSIAISPKANAVRSGFTVSQCHSESDQKASELCAQWRSSIADEKAASSAEVANFIDGAGALLSFVSILLVLVALAQNRRANKLASEEFNKSRSEAADLAKETASALAQARRSADAATAQSAIASKVFNQEFRPYVIVRAQGLNVDRNTGQPSTQVMLVNIGRGVARSCRVYAATEIGHYLSPSLGGVELVGGAGSHLMPTELCDLPVRPKSAFQRSQLEEIETGHPNRMWTHGRVEYSDEAGNMHVSHFAFAYTGGPLVRAEGEEGTARYENPLELPPPT